MVDLIIIRKLKIENGKRLVPENFKGIIYSNNRRNRREFDLRTTNIKIAKLRLRFFETWYCGFTGDLEAENE